MLEDKEFFIDKDGFKLHAKMEFPAVQSEKMPLVVLAHGLTGHMDEPHIVGLAKSIVDSGYISLRVELYGHGKSDGDFYNHNMLEWVSELAYVVEYASRLDFVSEVVLSGHSQGGFATVLAAGLLKDRLKAIMLFSPALVIPDNLQRGFFFETTFDPEDIPEEVVFWGGNRLSGNYIRIAKDIDCTDAIKAYEGPVLVVHGEADDAVPFKYGKNVAAQYKNGTLVTLENDGHCYEKHLDVAMNAVEKFLKCM